MPLQSQLFSGDRQLEACLTQDSAHVVPGAFGNHVAKIQTALAELDDASIEPSETSAARYGPSTAAAVLSFKQSRKIINFSYQTQADNIVGKMTIATLDQEMFKKEQTPVADNTCHLIQPCPCDTPNPPVESTGRISLGILPVRAGLVSAPAPSDADLMNRAFKDSRNTLRKAVREMSNLIHALTVQAQGGASLDAENQRVFKATIKWLAMNTRADQVAAVAHIQAAINLMNKNLGAKTSTGAQPPLARRNIPDFGQADGNADNGARFGPPFFSAGPHCRRDVLTHEFFHFFGVGHGGGSLTAATNRAAITTPAQALNSADNLAQLVAQINSIHNTTDACARAGE